MKLPTLLILLAFLLVAVFWIWYLFFNIFEVKFESIPADKEISQGTKVIFKVVPINALGNRALWRSAKLEVGILEGGDLVKRLKSPQDCEAIFEVIGETGKVKFRLSSPLALSPSDFEYEVKK